MNIKNEVLGVGLLLVAGVGGGVAAESNTNEIAHAKARTAETCLSIIAHEVTITGKLDDCLENGVPGGAPIGEDKIKAGQQVEFVDTYIQAQRDEARQIEAGRLVIWSAAPIGAVVVFFATLG